MKKKKKKPAKIVRVVSWFLVIAVPVVFFTFAGVNTLLPGLHSYG